MSEPLSVALLGLWHVHGLDYAATALAHPGTQLVAVWDEDAERGRAGAKRLGVEFSEDLDALLSRPELDGVIVTTATNQHHEVIGAAIRAGKHVFTEKLLAPTVVQSEELVTLAQEHSVELVVSLPRLYEPLTLAVMSILRHRRLGRLTYTRVRMAHDGWVKNWLPDRFGDATAAIGGALADLGCHPAYLTQLFLGTDPCTVAAACTRVSGHAVEDNAVVTTTYPDGAIGVFEASTVTAPGAATLELRGTEGALLSGFGGSALLAHGDHFHPDTWTAVNLPSRGPGPFGRWVRQIRGGMPKDDNTRRAVELTRLIVAANRAAETGTTLRYPPSAPE